MSRNPMPPGRWDECVSRDRYQCQARTFDPSIDTDCAGPLVVHHRKPKGAGGTSDPSIHDLSNLITLCDHHHREVHNRPERSYRSGLLVRRAA